MPVLIISLALIALTAPTFALAVEISVVDDFGRQVVLQKPARRILSLAPHITENLFSAGAGEYIVGVSDYSDFPVVASKLPSVGSYIQFNIESVLSLEPDLVVAWQTGSNAEALTRLEQLGLKIYYSEPRHFNQIVENITELATLAGTEDRIDPLVSDALELIDAARDRYQKKSPVSVFYQVWSDPLMTLNGEHFISRVLEICGARNLFSELPIIAPRVSVEAVIDANPDVIASGEAKGRKADFSMWQKWQSIAAVRNNALVVVDSDVMHRHTLRLLSGIPDFCEQIDQHRQSAE